MGARTVPVHWEKTTVYEWVGVRRHLSLLLQPNLEVPESTNTEATLGSEILVFGNDSVTTSSPKHEHCQVQFPSRSAHGGAPSDTVGETDSRAWEHTGRVEQVEKIFIRMRIFVPGFLQI